MFARSEIFMGGVIYTRRGHTYGGTYIQRNIHTEEHTLGGAYIWRRHIHKKDIHTEEHTLEGTYIDTAGHTHIYAERIYIRRSMHSKRQYTVGHTQG